MSFNHRQLAAAAVLFIACSDASSAAPSNAMPASTSAVTAPPTTGAGSTGATAKNPAPLASPSQATTTLATVNTASASAGVSGTAAAAMSGAMSMAAATTAGLPVAGGVAEPARVPMGPSGFVSDPLTGELVFRTEPVEILSGKETYTCFAATLAQDEVIDGFKKGAQAFVHHIQFAKTLDGAEPSGLSECDVLFKVNWLPIFLTGAGASELRLDEGVGHKLPAGTQLLAQLHLLNSSDKDIKQQVEIRMHRSASANPTPVSTWAIGSSEINIAPKQPGRAQNVCRVLGDVNLVAAFPHMHMIGTRLEVEVGRSVDAMRRLYLRDPYDFDDQHMEALKLSLHDGDMVRVTCDYMNTYDAAAQFGESSHDEMCFFIGFAIGDPPLADCPHLWENVLTKLF